MTGQVADQSGAVGVVTEMPARWIQYQGVDGTGAFRPGAACVCQCPGSFLEGDGNVEALATACQEAVHGLLETVEFNQDGRVFKHLSCLLCKQRVDAR